MTGRSVPGMYDACPEAMAEGAGPLHALAVEVLVVDVVEVRALLAAP